MNCGTSYTHYLTVPDTADNCTMIDPIQGNKIDRLSPHVTILSPTASSTLVLKQVILVDYSCMDTGSGVATCKGTTASGDALDTASIGGKSLSVSAIDLVGNTTQQKLDYTVSYGICLLYDPMRSVNSDSTLPIRLQLCDAQGRNVSASKIMVRALGITPGTLDDSGKANPDGFFRYDPKLGNTGGYIYNLSTRGFKPGTYNLRFSVVDDPIPHEVQVIVR